jgi:tetratricopeptide (TPR) repeat protein
MAAAMAAAAATPAAPSAPLDITVQLVGPSWGAANMRHKSASLLRKQAAARRVQEEYRRSRSCRDCAPVDVRQALAQRGIACRRSAPHAELVTLVERSLPWPDESTDEMDSVQCAAAADWIAADVRAVVAKSCGVAKRRLQGLYAGDALAPESATLGALGVAAGATVQLIVNAGGRGASGEQTPPRRAATAQDAVLRQRAKDEKIAHVTTVRALFDAGEAHQRAAEWRLAADSYSQAIIASRADDPALLSLLSNRGLCRARMGEWRNGWMDHNRALELSNSMHGRTLHYLNRGLCSLRLGMLEEAHDDFDSAANHATSESVSRGAAKQLQQLVKPLRIACEGQFTWLGTYYPSILRNHHCASVEAFQSLCKKVRERLGREYAKSATPLGQRHDRCALVHKAALEMICLEQDFDPGPVTEGARAEFERIIKAEARALLEEQQPRSATSAAAVHGENGDNAGEGEVETLHETETRLARENEEEWIAKQDAMVGNAANGFVLRREREAIHKINHRAINMDTTNMSAEMSRSRRRRMSGSSGNDSSAAGGKQQQQRPSTAPPAGRSMSMADVAVEAVVQQRQQQQRPHSAADAGTAGEGQGGGHLVFPSSSMSAIHSMDSVGSVGSRAAVEREKSSSLEATFRQALPTGIDSTEPPLRPSTAQYQKRIAQQRSITRLAESKYNQSAETKAKAMSAPVKVLVGGIAMETPAQKQAKERKMQRCRRETARRLNRSNVWVGNGKHCKGSGGDGRSTPSVGQLYDTTTYSEKTNQRGGPPGKLFTGRATRVSKMGLRPETRSMESLLGDWTKAQAVAHFFANNQQRRPASAAPAAPAPAPASAAAAAAEGSSSSSQSASSSNNNNGAAAGGGGGIEWSAWSAWQEELSYRQYEEDKAQGNLGLSGGLSMTMRGCGAGMLTVPRFVGA